MLVIIFIKWAWKAANSYLVATLAKKNKKEKHEHIKENECDCCNNETENTRRVTDIKLTTP